MFRKLLLASTHTSKHNFPAERNYGSRVRNTFSGACSFTVIVSRGVCMCVHVFICVYGGRLTEGCDALN